MSNPHVMGAAKGQHPKGQHRMVVEKVGNSEREKFEYDLRCEDCGTLLGSIRHTSAKPEHDPADCGLICGVCDAARADAEAQAVEEQKAAKGKGAA